MCNPTTNLTNPLAPTTSTSGKYSITINIPKGLNSSHTCITYAGRTYTGCAPDPNEIPVVAVAVITAIEDMVRASIDPDYVVLPIVGMGPQTLSESQDFFNQYYITGTPDPVRQAAVSCLIAQVYFAVRGAVIASLTAPPASLCNSDRSFRRKAGSCATIDIAIN